MQILCPKSQGGCGGKAVISSSKKLADTVTESYCICKNAECGHTFKMTHSFTHTLSPSAHSAQNLLVDMLKNLSTQEQMAIIKQVQQQQT